MILGWLIRSSHALHAGTPWSTRTRRTEGVLHISNVFLVQTLVSSDSGQESVELLRAQRRHFSSHPKGFGSDWSHDWLLSGVLVFLWACVSESMDG